MSLLDQPGPGQGYSYDQLTNWVGSRVSLSGFIAVYTRDQGSVSSWFTFH